jgi:hypothetical protein
MDGKFVFYTLSSSSGQIATAISFRGTRCNQPKCSREAMEDSVKILRRKTNVFLPLKEILLEAGFKEVSKDYDLDLTQLSRDTLINLFDKE